ncbi:hypothetical protein ACFL0W_00885 [Nanoarchaeota archaeon]
MVAVTLEEQSRKGERGIITASEVNDNYLNLPSMDDLVNHALRYIKLPGYDCFSTDKDFAEYIKDTILESSLCAKESFIEGMKIMPQNKEDFLSGKFVDCGIHRSVGDGILRFEILQSFYNQVLYFLEHDGPETRFGGYDFISLTVPFKNQVETFVENVREKAQEYRTQ